MKLSDVKRSSYILLIGLVFFAICWISAALADRTWEFGVQTMSELGISDTAARYWFLIGCVGTGFCVTLYGMIEAANATLGLQRYFYRILPLAGVLLIGIGIFTMDFGKIHGFFAITFFLTIYVAMIVYALYATYEKKTLISAITWIIIVIGAILLVLTKIAFVEPVFVILFMVWIGAIDMSKYIWKNDAL